MIVDESRSHSDMSAMRDIPRRGFEVYTHSVQICTLEIAMGSFKIVLISGS